MLFRSPDVSQGFGSSAPSSSRFLPFSCTTPCSITPTTSSVGGLDARISLGALFEILLASSNIATAVVFFPVLKRVNESVALGYVASRIVESAMIVTGLISLMTVVTLRDDFGGGADPASLNIAAGVLLGATRRLDHAVEAHELADHHSHRHVSIHQRALCVFRRLIATELIGTTPGSKGLGTACTNAKPGTTRTARSRHHSSPAPAAIDRTPISHTVTRTYRRTRTRVMRRRLRRERRRLSLQAPQRARRQHQRCRQPALRPRVRSGAPTRWSRWLKSAASAAASIRRRCQPPAVTSGCTNLIRRMGR